MRDDFLKRAGRINDPHKRVIRICRLAEAARKERPEEAEAIKRACFHACLEAMRAGRQAK